MTSKVASKSNFEMPSRMRHGTHRTDRLFVTGSDLRRTIMNGPVRAVYYGDDAARPHDATVEWRSADAIEVRLADRTDTWNLRAPGLTWEVSAGSLRISYGVPPHTLIIKDAAAITTWTTHFKTHRIPKSKEGRVPWLLTIPMMLPLGFIALCAAAYFWLLPI